MSDLTVFNFRGVPLRVFGDHENPWFIAADVCDALGLKSQRSSLALLADDEKGVHTVDTPGGPQESITVNECGLWRLVFKSRKPEAEAFKRWIAAEVLPSLRRFGFYGSPERMAEFLDQKVGEMVQRQMYAHLRIMEGKIADFDFWPLSDYARQKKVTLDAKAARLVGGALAVICRKAGLRMGKTHGSSRFTSTNRTFPRSVLDAHFQAQVDRFTPKATQPPLLVMAGGKA